VDSLRGFYKNIDKWLGKPGVVSERMTRQQDDTAQNIKGETDLVRKDDKINFATVQFHK
jgi:hypothetical protein